MKKRRLWIRTVVFSLLLAAFGFSFYTNMTNGDIPKVEIGDKVPDFVLFDLDGEKHRLSSYEGQGVFLNFWGSFCKPCEEEMSYINHQYQRFKDQGVQVLAVNVGETEFAVNKFVERHHLEFPVVIDKTGDVQTAYGINPLPITFLLDKEGIVVRSYTGPLTEDLVNDFMREIQP